jgi:hypothetical protein
VYQESDPNIEICQPFHDGTDDNEIGEANSRLIAAAPLLYEALAAIERSTDYGADDDRPLMRAARAALAKARGETP